MAEAQVAKPILIKIIMPQLRFLSQLNILTLYYSYSCLNY